MSLVRHISDFVEIWNYESEATLKVFNNLTDDSLSQKVTDQGRSLGFLAWHITQSIGEMMSKTGMEFPGFEENAPAPKSANEIVKLYEKYSLLMLNQVQTWNDNMLTDQLDMYGQKWLRADVLSSLAAHQNHHRGQMTVLMRQAGLKVPGVYGPAKEEWAQFGMPAME